jgi:hypothetical protein
MTNKAKVALFIILSTILFVVLTVGGFVYWLSQNKEMLKQNQTAGLAYGKQTDDHGCWQEALRRQTQVKGYKDNVGNNSFLLACLAAAANPPDFCDNVPRPGEIIATTQWSLQRCGEPDLKQLSKSDCQGLLHTVQTYCSEYYKR